MNDFFLVLIGVGLAAFGYSVGRLETRNKQRRTELRKPLTPVIYRKNNVYELFNTQNSEHNRLQMQRVPDAERAGHLRIVPREGPPAA